MVEDELANILFTFHKLTFVVLNFWDIFTIWLSKLL